MLSKFSCRNYILVHYPNGFFILELFSELIDALEYFDHFLLPLGVIEETLSHGFSGCYLFEFDVPFDDGDDEGFLFVLDPVDENRLPEQNLYKNVVELDQLHSGGRVSNTTPLSQILV